MEILKSPKCCGGVMTAFGFRLGFYQLQCESCGTIVNYQKKELEETKLNLKVQER